jgi:hypothetical protein
MFAKNVGAVDRAARIAAGLALVILAFVWFDGIAARTASTVLGVATAATGLFARCTIYYVLGYTTCPIAARPAPGK